MKTTSKTLLGGWLPESWVGTPVKLPKRPMRRSLEPPIAELERYPKHFISQAELEEAYNQCWVAFDRLLALQKKVGKPVEPGTFRFLWPRSRDVDRQKWLAGRMQTCKHLLANIFVALSREQEIFEGGEQRAPWC